MSYVHPWCPDSAPQTCPKAVLGGHLVFTRDLRAEGEGTSSLSLPLSATGMQELLAASCEANACRAVSVSFWDSLC